jgi:hypothetical protein
MIRDRRVNDEVLVQIGIGLGRNERMRRFVPVEELFKGRHFDQEIVMLNVCWYLTYKLISSPTN